VLKRAFDLFCTTLGLIATSPFFLLAAIAVKLGSKGPVFFHQLRSGRNGDLFDILKFRTMRDEPGKRITVGRDPRITGAGYWLRRSKLDELPQLINVWKGEMSLVGPRPEDPHYVALYSEEQKRVLTLRPGITDLASIKYRHESELLARSDDPERTYIEEIMPDKLQLNLEYLEKQSFWYDIGLILRTLARLFSSS
jgi:lipopolysaccharide/colanic/teichoic acid biosynthesis glycosyltransferase